ncbi:alpha/beta fold hydrolase [cf. Phormidesmis sp. LEGE 11477]|uniref:alpha/beta fold hydrolase n=1 Tax=cf. Phormidesmis sp. LEGE 11477 TaxID=1828680 RepID=UPI00187FF975|nr:alpha/beta hydrolase [cf. Phormidesmis sp. LEGE 11477]MBE9060827.1 alpha/beta hydrolase [cf. Phormidesmis sp. LEGE 11477]
MHRKTEALWLSVSPHLKCFDQRLLSRLSKGRNVRRWQYCQTIDEPCSAAAVVESLHEYLRSRPLQSNGQPAPKVHLMGHGVSGAIGLLYARQYPQHVASLTLLSVGAAPAINWQAHYYALRRLIPCSREIILGQLVRLLFGEQAPRFATALTHLLAKDLDSNLTLHSLTDSIHIESGGAEVPLLICNGAEDEITVPYRAHPWQKWLKSDDLLWRCPEGRYFFHFHHCQSVAKIISNYWAQLPDQLATLRADQSDSSRTDSSRTDSSTTQVTRLREQIPGDLAAESCSITRHSCTRQ